METELENNIQRDIIVCNGLIPVEELPHQQYSVHLLVKEGGWTFMHNHQTFTVTANDLIIVPLRCLKLWTPKPSSCIVSAIYIDEKFLLQCQSNTFYSIRARLYLFLNPVIALGEAAPLGANLFRMVEERLKDTSHHFYREMISITMKQVFIDISNFLYDHINCTDGNTHIHTMSKFLNLLDEGAFRCQREVSWYANKLDVSTKHLTWVSRCVSGFPASYWINQYTLLAIVECLSDHSLTFTEISERFGFSSPAYFTHYVHQHLGLSPTQYREQKTRHI